MAVASNILQFRPRTSASDASREQGSMAYGATATLERALEQERRHVSEAAPVVRMEVQPKRYVLARSSVPKMDSFAQEDIREAERESKRGSKRRGKSVAASQNEAAPSEKPSHHEPMQMEERTASRGTRLVRPFQAAPVVLAGQGEASIALPLDNPWLAPEPLQPKTNRRADERRETTRERAAQPSVRERAARGIRGISLPGVSGLSDGLAAILERVRSVSNRLLIALICVAVATIFLYGPTRELYRAHRDQQILSTKLEQIAESNEQLQQSVISLQTREGIEDEARKRGLVNAGETSVEVDGLEEYKDAQQEAISELTKAYEDTTETPIHIKVLDFLFQYSFGE